MADLTIGALAQDGGVGVETIRFYQRRGLMRVPQQARGMRRYAAEDARRLRFIRSAQTAGFTLDAIGELLALDASHDRARARAMTLDRIAELDAKIATLTEARTALSRLADECCASSKGPDLLPGNHAIGKLARQMETSDAAKPIYRRSDHWGAARA